MVRNGNLPSCPYCRHTRSVRAAAAVARTRPPDSFGAVLERELGAIGALRLAGSASLTKMPARSRLPRHLRPPAPPRTYRGQLDHHATVTLNFAFLSLMFFLAGRALNAVEGVLVAAVLVSWALLYVVWFVAAIVTGRLRRRTAAIHAAYQRALRRWQSLYCCGECDVVFASGWTQPLPPQRVQDYLYAGAVTGENSPVTSATP